MPESFASVASLHFSGVGPLSDKAVVMWHALRSHNLFFLLSPVSGSEQGSFRHS